MYILLVCLLSMPYLLLAQTTENTEPLFGGKTISISQFQLGIEFGTESFMPRSTQTIEINDVEGFYYANALSPSAMLKFKYTPTANWAFVGGLGWMQQNTTEEYYCHVCDMEQVINQLRRSFISSSAQAQYLFPSKLGIWHIATGLQYNRILGSQSRNIGDDFPYRSILWNTNKNILASISNIGWSKKLSNRFSIGAELGYAYYVQTINNDYYTTWSSAPKQLINQHSIRTNIGLYYHL